MTSEADNLMLHCGADNRRTSTAASHPHRPIQPQHISHATDQKWPEAPSSSHPQAKSTSIHTINLRGHVRRQPYIPGLAPASVHVSFDKKSWNKRTMKASHRLAQAQAIFNVCRSKKPDPTCQTGYGRKSTPSAIKSTSI